MISDLSVRLAPYSPAAVLQVSGEDALAFLQGQFTQELRSPLDRFLAYGLWLNQKGKVLADSFALKDGAIWWLVSSNSPAETIKARLEAYIIADDVVITDVTSEWNGYAILGPKAAAWLQTSGVTLPGPGEYAKVGKGLVFRGRRETEETWEWLQPRLWQVWPELVRKNAMLAQDDLEAMRIAAGIPRVPEDVGPGDLPNEAGLENTAISYSKGCYLGQEVMARLKSMGQVRRKLFRVRDSLEPTAAAGSQSAGKKAAPAPLFHAGKKVGELRSASFSDKGLIGLAMFSLPSLGSARTCGFSETGPESLEILD